MNINRFNLKKKTCSILKIALALSMLTQFSEVLAQGTQASIRGQVKGNTNSPIKNTTITIKNESTGFVTTAVSNESGLFDIKQLPLGGPYTISVKDMEKGNGLVSGVYLNQGDVAAINISLVPSENSIETIEVNASSLKNTKDYLGAATAFSSATIKSLPVNGRNFTSLSDLSPLSRGGSISGQLGSSVNFTIDGMNAKNPTSSGSTTSRSGAPYSLSMEAVREFKVVTNQYDVTFGRSGGGTISAATKSGTNTFTGSVFTYGRTDWLTSKYDIQGNKRIGNYSTYQYGFSLGGPIIKDKLHFFAVWDRQQDNRSLLIADIRSGENESLYKINETTLNRYLDIGRSKYGVSSINQTGAIDKKRTSDAGFLRLDWQIDQNNLLTIRNNLTYDYNPLGLSDNTAINILESYGNDKNFDNSLLATLRSSINSKITNELKVQHLYVYQNSTQGDQIGNNYIPRAIVENVTSSIGGNDLQTNLQLGGHRFAQEGFKNNVFQIVNNLYYDTDWAKYTFGADVMATSSNSRYGSEVNGRFHFTGLDNFDNLTPYRYYREVPLKEDISVNGTIMNFGLYGQLRKNLTPSLELTAGLRMDYASYPKATFNQLVFDELGLKTDNKLSSFILQPRIQFNWDINQDQTDYLRFGAGVFASDINNYMIINNLTFDGSNFATVDVRGSNVPVPNFSDYRSNINAIPSLTAFQLPTINFTGQDAKVPTIYKANISYTKFFNDKFKTSLSAYMTLGRNNYTYIDRNMVADPFFSLVNEDNRGVFVPASSIPDNGQPDWQEGKISNKLGRVLELTSLGKINQYAVVFDATYNYFKDGVINVSYTWNDAKDNTSFNGNVANSATLSQPVVDDPRNLNTLTYSDNQFRHKVVVYGSLPTFYGVKVGVRYSGIGGTRFSLLSGVNNNGDFVTSSNDLAYVFDYKNNITPGNIRTGIQGILDNPNASQSMKDFLISSAGKIATRNGGENGFFGTIDLRVSKELKFYKTHGIELSAEIFNFANMLNKDRGVTKVLGNQSLYGLPKTGAFNQTTQVFSYMVNNIGAVNYSGNPFQVQLGVRYSF